MAILNALQSAAVRLVGRKPTAFFSVSDGLEAELCDLANESIASLVKAHDWRALTKLATLNADGSTIEFTLPSDYDRMVKAEKVWSTQWPGLFFEKTRDLDQWYYNKAFITAGVPGWWILLGGKMQVFPAASGGSKVQFYYVSNGAVTDKDGNVKSSFGADSDKVVFPERLLTLDLMWRWRSQKRLEYAEDMQNFELAKSEIISADKGSRVIAEGTPRLPGNIGIAYPGVLG